MVLSLVQPQGYRSEEFRETPLAQLEFSRWSVAEREPDTLLRRYADTGSSTIGISQGDVEVVVDILERHYALRGRDSVTSFLRRHPFLVPLLLEAPGIVRQYFPPCRLVLEVVADPEMTDDEQLMTYIGTDLGPEEALSRLDQLDEDWWLDALDRAEGNMCINLEFV